MGARHVPSESYSGGVCSLGIRISPGTVILPSRRSLAQFPCYEASESAVCVATDAALCHGLHERGEL